MKKHRKIARRIFAFVMSCVVVALTFVGIVSAEECIVSGTWVWREELYDYAINNGTYNGRYDMSFTSNGKNCTAIIITGGAMLYEYLENGVTEEQLVTVGSFVDEENNLDGSYRYMRFGSAEQLINSDMYFLITRFATKINSANTDDNMTYLYGGNYLFPENIDNILSGHSQVFYDLDILCDNVYYNEICISSEALYFINGNDTKVAYQPGRGWVLNRSVFLSSGSISKNLYDELISMCTYVESDYEEHTFHNVFYDDSDNFPNFVVRLDCMHNSRQCYFNGLSFWACDDTFSENSAYIMDYDNSYVGVDDYGNKSVVVEYRMADSGKYRFDFQKRIIYNDFICRVTFKNIDDIEVGYEDFKFQELVVNGSLENTITYKGYLDIEYELSIEYMLDDKYLGEYCYQGALDYQGSFIDTDDSTNPPISGDVGLSFYGFINAIISAPFTFIEKALNFDVFGVNVLSTVRLLITAVIVYFIIRFFISKKG